jgi:hypothetical protein
MVVRGRLNSSITRVRPVFQALLRRDPTGTSWVWTLLGMATCNDAYAGAMQKNVGELRPHCIKLRTYDDRVLKFYGVDNIQLAGCFEPSLPPPSAFLSWLIKHPEQMVWPHTKKGRGKFGQTAQDRREKLFGEHGRKEQQTVQEEALNELALVGAPGSLRKWWAFEGFSSIDCFLETDSLLLLIEGKRTEPLGPSTNWYPKRNQLIRNLEVAHSLASGREFGVLVISEKDIGPLSKDTIDASLPHLGENERIELMRHYFGCMTWESVCKEMGTSFKSLPSETEVVAADLKTKGTRKGDRLLC